MRQSSLTLISLVCLAASITPDAHAQQTRVLTADKHNEYGLVYNLPVTALEFQVTARCTKVSSGPYYQYAKKFLGTDRVPAHDSETWEIVSVKATPYGVADPEQSYLMQLKPGALTSICVAPDGMLLGINCEPTLPSLPEIPEDTKTAPEAGRREYLQYVNEDFLASQSSATQARMLSEALMEVRDAKVSLTRGTAETMPTDGRQLELMLNSLAHQEAAMSAAFLGTRATETVTRKFTFTPGQENGRTVLFRMSDFAGFVGADDLSGDPVYVSVEVVSQGELPVDAKGEEKRFPKDGVAYTIPGSARISLTLKGTTLWSKEVELAQLGTTFGLAPNLFSDKKSRSAATFDPATGALKEIRDIE